MACGACVESRCRCLGVHAGRSKSLNSALIFFSTLPLAYTNTRYSFFQVPAICLRVRDGIWHNNRAHVKKSASGANAQRYSHFGV